VPRFHRAARRLLDHGDHDGQVLADFLRTGGFSRYFTAHFALPLVAAVWSCPTGTALRYPARYLFAFLANHGMLSVSGSPPWRTVTGGSRRYVERAAKRLDEIRLSTPVRAVRRYPDHAEVLDAVGETHRFDAVVIATHPDQALRLLDPPTDAERDVLGAFSYTQNPALLHTDATVLPRRPAVRASWNYELSGCEPDRAAPRISYHMNRLQNLASREDYIVTLGGPVDPGPVDPGRVIDRMEYAHPAYTPASVAAQRRLPGLNTHVTAFAGAYHGWGFHEDGCRSGAAAARSLGGTW
jgi:predicted NAD/FAD-binding protein